MVSFSVTSYQTADQPWIRSILAHIGWEEVYIRVFEQTAVLFAERDDTAVFVARSQATILGFIFVQYYFWNRLAQVQGLAVDPAVHRQGIASALVAEAEHFAHARDARGIYVDTPSTNSGGRRFYEAANYHFGYTMPQYYDAMLDGITYQKFFGVRIDTNT